MGASPFLSIRVCLSSSGEESCEWLTYGDDWEKSCVIDGPTTFPVYVEWRELNSPDWTIFLYWEGFCYQFYTVSFEEYAEYYKFCADEWIVPNNKCVDFFEMWKNWKNFRTIDSFSNVLSTNRSGSGLSAAWPILCLPII